MSMLQAAALTLLPPFGGFLMGQWTLKDIKNWYPKLNLPSWRPPNWVFGPVWTTLYASMGYASYLILRDGLGDQRNLALTLYGSQLALNFAWSPIFFIKHKIGLSVINILALWANIGACIWAFYPINRTAAYLMVPYLAWCSFASAVNISIWKLNRSKRD